MEMSTQRQGRGETVLSRGRGVKKLEAGQPLIRCCSLSQAVGEVGICPASEAGQRSPSLITVPGTALQASRHVLLSSKRCLPNFKFLVGSSVRTENLVGCRLDHIAHFSGIIELSEGVTFMGLDSSQGHGLMSRKLNWSPVPSP